METHCWYALRAGSSIAAAKAIKKGGEGRSLLAFQSTLNTPKEYASRKAAGEFLTYLERFIETRRKKFTVKYSVHKCGQRSMLAIVGDVKLLKKRLCVKSLVEMSKAPSRFYPELKRGVVARLNSCKLYHIKNGTRQI